MSEEEIHEGLEGNICRCTGYHNIVKAVQSAATKMTLRGRLCTQPVIKPENLDAAISALQEADEGKILAGGMTLIPTLKQRLAAPDCLIDISALGLSGIRQQGDRLIIGAMSCHADVEHSDLVVSELPVLARLAGGIGDRQVRNRGTIGGSLANNDPPAIRQRYWHWPPASIPASA